MRNLVFRYTEIQITRIKNFSIKEIKLADLQKYKIPNWRNTTCRSVEIQMTYLQKYKWLLNDGWLLNYGWLLNFG